MYKMTNYMRISNFGSGAANDPNANPLSYVMLRTVDSPFSHGGIANTISSKYDRNAQAFSASYCADKWDNVCEFLSHDRDTNYPNSLGTCGGSSDTVCRGLTAGEILIQNTAARKYLKFMSGNCTLKYEPFDPTVAASPMISYWQGSCNGQGNDGCVPVYEVDPKNIDDDPVMNKILQKPAIAWNILMNIYNTAIRHKTIDQLKGTKIYNLFMSKEFQQYNNLRKSDSCLGGKCASC